MFFRVLGLVDFVRSSGEQVVVRQSKQRAVLSVLLLHANRWVGVGRLIDVVWGEKPPRSAAGNLKTYIWRLRQLLAEGDQVERIVSGPGGYQIRLARDELDASLFEDLVLAGRQALQVGQLDRAAATLSSALGLWRGEPFGDWEAVAAESTVIRLRDRWRAAQEEFAVTRLALGDHNAVIPEVRALVSDHPLQERPRALLMFALYRAGRQAEALEVFQATRELLDRELGLRPGAELVRLHQAILGQDPRLDDGVELLGVASIVGDGLDDVPLVLDEGRLAPVQLPAEIASFVGRDSHLAHLDRVLGDGTGIAVIAGAAGVGKTALALRWAHRSRSLFPDGIVYLRMLGFSAGLPVQSADAVAQVLRSLGVSPDRVPVGLAELTAVYRSLLDGRRVLLVIDDVHSAGQVRPLLPGHSTCATLITSRNRLRGLFALDDANCLSLDVLADTEAHALFVTLLGAERILAEPVPVRELAELCGHLPLALRIAAANLAGPSYGSIADFVSVLARGDRVSALAVAGDEDAALKPAFDASYHALSAEAGVLFRRLGLFPGPMLTSLVAATVLGVPVDRAATLLDLLHGVHLLEQLVPGEYRFHDLLRVYARDRAATEETSTDRTTVLARVLRFYLTAAEIAASLVAPGVDRLAGPSTAFDGPLPAISDSSQAAAWFEREQPNLTSLIRYAADHDMFPFAWLLADAQRGYFWLRRYGSDWLTNATAGLRAATRANDLAGQAAMHRMIGLIQSSVGEPDNAVVQHNRALALFRSIGDRYGEASTLTNLGIVFWDTGVLDEAREHYEQALRVFEELGHDYGVAAARTNVGRVYQQLGRLDDAIEQHEHARVVFQQLGNHYGAAAALNGLGHASLEAGRVDDAIAAHSQVLAMGDQPGSYERVVALTGVGNAYRHKGMIAAAITQGEQARVLAQQAGLRVAEGFALMCLAESYLTSKRYGPCEIQTQHAVTLFRATSSRLGHAHALRVLGEARLHTQGVDLARSTWLSALSLCSADEPEAARLTTLLNQHGIDASGR